MLIRLDEHYRKFTNDFAEHEVEGATVQECMSELCNRYPQLLVHLQDNQGEICKRSGLKLNGEYLVEQSAKDAQVCSTDTLELTTEIPTGESNFIGAIIGAVLFIVGAILLVYGGWTWMPLAISMMQYGATMAVVGTISGLVMEFAFTPESQQQSNGSLSLLDNSATYTFNGIRNTTASGTPIQVVYGEHRVGGQVLNMYLTTDEGFDPAYGGIDTITSCNYLHAQIGLCEGAIHSVTDLQVNQLALSFYNEVTFDTRLGEGAQAVLPNFSFVQNTTSIGMKVLYGGTAQSVVSFSNYTPVYGVVTQNWSRFDLQLGMYSPTLTATEVY